MRKAVATTLGTVAVVASAAGYLTRSSTRRQTVTDKRKPLVAYLRDHLSGSDVAINVVRRLRGAHEGTDEGQLFAFLADEFEKDREVVRLLLADLGASGRSIKRAAGHASGALLSMTASGRQERLSALRTLEALAMGAQGKRCMWRALHCLDGAVSAPAGVSFAELESRAVRQWEAIEQRRLAVATKIFPSVDVRQ